MTRPNIPTTLSFDGRGINNASAEYCPRLFTIAPGHTNDEQAQALGRAFAAVPALLEALEIVDEAFSKLPDYGEAFTRPNGWSVQPLAKVRSALIAAGYQF